MSKGFQVPDEEFVDQLLKVKQGQVGEVIEDLGFLEIEQNSIQNLHEYYKRVEGIFATYNLLEESNLVHTTTNRITPNCPDFNPSEFAVDEHTHERLSHIKDLLKSYWENDFKIDLRLYRFVENDYKTDEQAKSEWNFWLPVYVAIGTTVGVSILQPLIGWIFRNHIG